MTAELTDDADLAMVEVSFAAFFNLSRLVYEVDKRNHGLTLPRASE